MTFKLELYIICMLSLKASLGKYWANKTILYYEKEIIKIISKDTTFATTQMTKIYHNLYKNIISMCVGFYSKCNDSIISVSKA